MYYDTNNRDYYGGWGGYGCNATPMKWLKLWVFGLRVWVS
jgi:hypothetical protein